MQFMLRMAADMHHMHAEILQLRRHVSNMSRVVGDLQADFRDLFENQVDARNLNDERDRVTLSLNRLLDVHSLRLQTLGLQCAWP
jgi:hypothetical protein